MADLFWKPIQTSKGTCRVIKDFRAMGKKRFAHNEARKRVKTDDSPSLEDDVPVSMVAQPLGVGASSSRKKLKASR